MSLFKKLLLIGLPLAALTFAPTIDNEAEARWRRGRSGFSLYVGPSYNYGYSRNYRGYGWQPYWYNYRYGYRYSYPRSYYVTPPVYTYGSPYYGYYGNTYYNYPRGEYFYYYNW